MTDHRKQIHRDDGDVVSLLRDLVRFDTTSDRSNLDFISYVESYLGAHGVPSFRVYDDTGLKANLVASFGPVDRPGYILSGHTDVVPADEAGWSQPPFDLREANGRLYGRGTCDMKGFLAVCLALAPELCASSLRQPVHLALSYDEEVGCLGAPRLAAAIRKRFGPQCACIVGEPTGMEVVIGHKANRALRVRVASRAMHSSLAPSTANAIEVASRLICHLASMASDLGRDEIRDPLYDVPHSTISVGTIEGGTGMNVVPANCEFVVEFRTLPATDSGELAKEMQRFAMECLLPEIQKKVPEASITFQEIMAYPGLDTTPEAAIVTETKLLAGREGFQKVAYGTEAALFSTIGETPTVVIGPGSIWQAHQVDEYIEIDQLSQCRSFLTKLLFR